jgi:tetratricopeptide (TPR) repeat protein
MRNSILLVVAFIASAFTFVLTAANVAEEKPSVSISVNDIIILSDVEKVMEYAKAKGLSERALEQVNTADKAYLEGVKLLQQDKHTEAIASFKTAFKNYKRAKLNEDALNFPNVQLAVAHALSSDPKNNKKVSRYMDLFTKAVYKERDWTYNVAILNYSIGQEQRAAELLESVIKMDKFFFKAYGNLAAVYQAINDKKKAEKTMSRLALAQEILAEKERKAKLAAAKEKEKGDATVPSARQKQHPEGIAPDATTLEASGDAKTVMQHESIAAFDERTRKKIREGQELFDEGVSLFNQGEYDLATKSFKTSLKKYTQAKVSQPTLNYITASLAMSYFRSPNERNHKKVIPLLEGLSKEIFNERDWVYNMAVMYHGLGNSARSMELLEQCTEMDPYFLLGYQNQVAVHNEMKALKEAEKAHRLYERYKLELTEIYKEFVRTGKKNDKVNLSFLDGAIFRIALGTYSEYSMPVDIYLHEDLVTLPLGDDYYEFTCGNYENYLQAEAYLKKLKARGYEFAHVIAFKDGVRTDFSAE